MAPVSGEGGLQNITAVLLFPVKGLESRPHGLGIQPLHSREPVGYIHNPSRGDGITGVNQTSYLIEACTR